MDARKARRRIALRDPREGWFRARDGTVSIFTGIEIVASVRGELSGQARVLEPTILIPVFLVGCIDKRLVVQHEREHSSRTTLSASVISWKL